MLSSIFLFSFFFFFLIIIIIVIIIIIIIIIIININIDIFYFSKLVNHLPLCIFKIQIFGAVIVFSLRKANFVSQNIGR